MTPYFASFQEFLQMGGHAPYVWVCYTLVFGAVLALIIHAKRERSLVLQKLTKQQNNRLTNKQRKQA